MISTVTMTWAMICAASNRTVAIQCKKSENGGCYFRSIKPSNWNDAFVSNATYLHRNANIWPAKFIWRRPRWRSGSKIIDTRRSEPKLKKVSTIRNIIMAAHCHHRDVLPCQFWCETANRHWWTAAKLKISQWRQLPAVDTWSYRPTISNTRLCQRAAGGKPTLFLFSFYLK